MCVFLAGLPSTVDAQANIDVQVGRSEIWIAPVSADQAVPSGGGGASGVCHFGINVSRTGAVLACQVEGGNPPTLVQFFRGAADGPKVGEAFMSPGPDGTSQADFFVATDFAGLHALLGVDDVFLRADDVPGVGEYGGQFVFPNQATVWARSFPDESICSLTTDVLDTLNDTQFALLACDRTASTTGRARIRDGSSEGPVLLELENEVAIPPPSVDIEIEGLHRSLHWDIGTPAPLDLYSERILVAELPASESGTESAPTLFNVGNFEACVSDAWSVCVQGGHYVVTVTGATSDGAPEAVNPLLQLSASSLSWEALGGLGYLTVDASGLVRGVLGEAPEGADDPAAPVWVRFNVAVTDTQTDCTVELELSRTNQGLASTSVVCP